MRHDAPLKYSILLRDFKHQCKDSNTNFLYKTIEAIICYIMLKIFVNTATSSHLYIYTYLVGQQQGMPGVHQQHPGGPAPWPAGNYLL